MADAPEPEGWGIRLRPAAIAAVITPVALLVAIVASGWYYTAQLRPQTREPVTTFPAPGIETAIHPGGGDPAEPTRRRRPDPRLAAATDAVVREGLPGWRSAR